MESNHNKLTSKEVYGQIDRMLAHELLSEASAELINFSKSNTLNYCLNKKSKSSNQPNTRILYNWIDKGLIEVSSEDKGKINRFTRLENIWISVISELRDFGVPIKSIERLRKLMFNYVVNDFTLFRFYVLETILGSSRIFVIYKDGTCQVTSRVGYSKQIKRGFSIPNINIFLKEHVKANYLSNIIDNDFEIDNFRDDIDKMKLMYFIKTGDFELMKIKLDEYDIRYIESPEMLINNTELSEKVKNWKFKDITISIDNETDTIIQPKH